MAATVPTATMAMINQNPVVVHIGGGKSVRTITSDFELVTEIDSFVALVVTVVRA